MIKNNRFFTGIFVAAAVLLGASGCGSSGWTGTGTVVEKDYDAAKSTEKCTKTTPKVTPKKSGPSTSSTPTPSKKSLDKKTEKKSTKKSTTKKTTKRTTFQSSTYTVVEASSKKCKTTKKKADWDITVRDSSGVDHEIEVSKKVYDSVVVGQKYTAK